MSDEKKQSPLSGHLLILFGFVLIAVSAYYLLSAPEKTAEEIQISAPKDAEDISPAIEAEEVDDDAAFLERALAPRTFGRDNAGLKVYEFASLSCGHCAHFHENAFKDITVEYVGTGKIQITFIDFPLEIKALDATMIARCLDPEFYVPFTSELFAYQKEWTTKDNYRDILIEKAAPYGLGKERAEACLANDALRQGILDNMQAAAKQWNINSTPSFIINQKEMISGAQPFEVFKEKFEHAFSPEAELEEAPAAQE